MQPWSKDRADELLSRGYWFGALPRAMKQSILDRGEIREFKSGAAVYRLGDPVDGMYAVLDGDLRAYVQGDEGERILLRLFGPRTWFGEFHLLDGYPTRTFEASTASHSSAFFLPKEAYDAIADEHPENYRHFVKLNCIHVRFLVRIAVEARSNAPRRTARTLIRIAKMHGQAVEGTVEIGVNVNQSELASLVGVSRQYMNELISAWNDQGLINWKGNGRPVVFVDKLKTLLTPLDDWMNDSESWV
jgi:CRP-like cAMP-binding protein